MQAIGSIMVNLRKLKGCINIDFQRDDHDEDQFCLRLNWQNGESVRSLFVSKEFDVFQGAIQVLCIPPTVEIDARKKLIKIETDKYREVSLSEQIIDKLTPVL